MFNYLIYVAVQATLDSKLFIDYLDNECIHGGIVCNIHEREWFKAYRDDSDKVILELINRIKSLYTETFTIENEDDLSKIKEGATVTLCNGVVLERQTPKVTPTNGLSFLDDDGDYCFLKFQILKGATVTQKGMGSCLEMMELTQPDGAIFKIEEFKND